MAPMISDNWADLLEPGVRTWFELGKQPRRDMIPVLFNVQASTKASEHVAGIGGVDPDSWETFSKTKQIAEVTSDPNYKTTFPVETYMVKMRIERELWEDDQYGEMQRRTMALAMGGFRKRQVDAANVFNNAFSSSFLGGDSKALCANDHPSGPDASGTQDNNFALTLTRSNVSTIREAMIDFRDDKGNLIGIIPDLLIVPPGLSDEAIEITQSLQVPDSANNAINAHQVRGLQAIEWEYLTDSNAWFLVDSMYMKMHLHWFDRVPLTVYLENSDTSAWANYIARMRYVRGWSDWRWVAGSNPS